MSENRLLRWRRRHWYWRSLERATCRMWRRLHRSLLLRWMQCEAFDIIPRCYAFGVRDTNLQIGDHEPYARESWRLHALGIIIDVCKIDLCLSSDNFFNVSCDALNRPTNARKNALDESHSTLPQNVLLFVSLCVVSPYNPPCFVFYRRLWTTASRQRLASILQHLHRFRNPLCITDHNLGDDWTSCMWHFLAKPKSEKKCEQWLEIFSTDFFGWFRFLLWCWLS